ncbi:hypothetical protein C8A00DRAFT_15769 [Chaetomidium leptoderma]|uniref:ATPase AAA-type core domain-containing protein n=1 Tax=Chaetomidium leptoderma TaxID=669021 RepID=A0AAN6ZV02_9PEZI|nr:hypothetical protein C8A00DRAFT_15769 [Chaetomidium leptoderma]
MFSTVTFYPVIQIACVHLAPSNLVLLTQSLSNGLVERISSTQLITESHDQRYASDPSSGNWTWFEVCIVGVTQGDRGEDKVEERRWMSHENAFLTASNAWIRLAAPREGRIFGDKHDLLKFLKSALQGKKVQVRACACFRGWKVVASRGFLVFNIGCETPVAGPTIMAPTDELLKGGPGEKVSYQVGDDIEAILQKDPPDIIIYKATTLEEARALKVPTEFDCYRLLVVMDAGDLLHNGFFSWDQTVEGFSVVGAEEKFHLLIRLGHEGAIYKPPHDGPQDSRQVLIFDSKRPQGHFPKPYLHQRGIDLEALKGNLQAAYLAGLAASLAKEFSDSLERLCETQVKEAAAIALRWSRRSAAAKHGNADPRLATWQKMKLDIAGDPVLIPIRLPGRVKTGSSLVFRAMPYFPIKHAAWDIVRSGRDAVLSFVPTASFEDLVTADRNEVHQFRKISHEMEKYLCGSSVEPLSIAVFGQPGSGKSWGVQQVILSITKEAGQKGNMATLKFDLSQFQGISDLQAAFETIRDESIGGKLLVVFFDEFDTTFNRTPLYWVQHLLKPIKEGKWEAKGGAERRLGRGIYIFIGGTAKTLKEFRTASSGITKVVAQNRSPSNDLLTPGSVPRDCESLSQLGGNRRGEPLHFKISPDKKYTDLVEFFYKVRERTVSKEVPVVFIEGFDEDLVNPSDPRQVECLGWLKYFLAPMQDGAFNDQGHSRPLGRVVFVFVGGESGLIQKFLDRQDETDFFQAAKDPDFMSRLRGYVTAPVSTGETVSEISTSCLETVVESYKKGDKGRNTKPLSLGFFRTRSPQLPADVYQRQLAGEGDEQQKRRQEFADFVCGRSVDIQGPNKVNKADEMFVVRRAILLRSLLDRLPKEQKIELEDHVLNAMLGVKSFHHGARSMEAILSMSKLTRDSLAAEMTQLKLHVGWSEFNSF